MNQRQGNRYNQQNYRQARQVFKERQAQPRPGNYRIRDYQTPPHNQTANQIQGNYRRQANYYDPGLRQQTRQTVKPVERSFNQRDYRKGLELWTKRMRQPRDRNVYQRGNYPNPDRNQRNYRKPPTSINHRSWYHRVQSNLLRNKQDSSTSKRPPLPGNRVQLLGVFSVLFFFYLLTGWQLMPMHRLNYITVSGNHYINGQTIIDSSRLNSLDNYRAVIKQADKIEAKIKEEIPMIESVLMHRNSWDNLDLQVKEYEMVALTEINGEILPVLANGQPLMANVPQKLIDEIEGSLPKIIDNNQKGKVIDLCNNALRNISPDLLAKMDVIQLSQDPSKMDSITVKMKDGNYVVAVINTFAQKMRYYPQIVDQLAGRVGTINLEVGAYFSPEEPTNSINLDNN